MMSPSEIEVGTHRYRLLPIDVRTQLHLSRRLGPIMMGVEMSVLTQRISPIANALAQLSDEDVNYVIDHVLDTTLRIETDGRGAPMRVSGRLQYDDIEMDELLEIVQKSLGRFTERFFGKLKNALQPPPGSGTSAAATGTANSSQ